MDPEDIDSEGASETPEEKAAREAFDAGFSGVRATGPITIDGSESVDESEDALEQAASELTQKKTRRRNKPTPASAPVDDAVGSATPEPDAPVVDPYADLQPAVRDALARLANLEADHKRTSDELSRANGRVAATQRELEALRRPAPASAPAGPDADAPTDQAPKNARVRGELPEVADAIEEAKETLRRELKQLRGNVAKPADAPAPAQPGATPADDAEDVEAKALLKLDPNWGQKVSSTDYALWLQSQPREVQQTARSTDKAIELLPILRDFDKFQEAVAANNAKALRRQSRTERAAAPPSAGARGGALNPTLTADQAFEQGFNRVRTGVA